jgi:hypothetical protein
MGGIVSDVLDAGAELISSVPVVGDFADNVLGIDPNGGGIMPIANVVAPLIMLEVF